MRAKWVPDASRRLLDPKTIKNDKKTTKKSIKTLKKRQKTFKKKLFKNAPDVFFATKLSRLNFQLVIKAAASAASPKTKSEGPRSRRAP